MVKYTGASHPRISVVMPTFNAAQYLREAVDSILSQTFTDFEFLIIDDNSTDETLDILNSYKDDRIRIIHGPQKGIAAALNCGIRESRGKYIARMDADDISLPNRFLMQFEFMETHNDIGICGSIVICLSEDGDKTIWRTIENPHVLDILINTAFCHSTVFFRKEYMEKYNLIYNENFFCAEDQELWFRAIKFTNFYNIQEPLLIYRSHENNKSKKTIVEGESNLCNIRKDLMNWLGINCTFDNINIKIKSLDQLIKGNQLSIQNNSNVGFQSWSTYYKKRYYIFGKIPLWKIRVTSSKIEYYLFNFICILKIKISNIDLK